MRSAHAPMIAAVFALGALAWPAAPKAQDPRVAAPTFSRDVAAIFNAHCVSCHRPGEIAPMSLTSFESSRPWARAIRKAVEARTMPPWYADPTIGEFANDPRLSDADVATIVSWVDRGSPEGSRADLPPTPTFPDGWKIGTPDLVVSMSRPAQIPAGGPRIIQDYPIDPITFAEDTYVERLEVVPSNRTVTHHAIVNVKDDAGTHRIGGYQPGGAITAYPRGVVRMIPKGAALTLNMHYNPKGEAANDQTKIALVLARGPIDAVALTAMSGTRELNIAPGDPDYEAKGAAFVFTEDSHIISLLPRMNERGKDYRYTLTYPDGRSAVLLSVPRFNPDWQPSYVFKHAVAAPKGSRLETLAHYDNSAANKSNPDPSQRVVFGPEIMNGYFDYAVDNQRPRGTKAFAIAPPGR